MFIHIKSVLQIIGPATAHYASLRTLKQVKISSSADAGLLPADPDTNSIFILKEKKMREWQANPWVSVSFVGGGLFLTLFLHMFWCHLTDVTLVKGCQEEEEEECRCSWAQEDWKVCSHINRIRLLLLPHI